MLTLILLGLCGAALAIHVEEPKAAALRHQVKVLRRQVRVRILLTNLDRFFGLASLVSLDLEGRRHHPAGNLDPLAAGRLSTLLALEVKNAGL